VIVELAEPWRRYRSNEFHSWRSLKGRMRAMALRYCLLAAACLVLGLTAAASAEEPVIRVSASAKAACLPDAMRLCRDAVPNVKNVLLCFGQHREQLSNRCRLVLVSYGLE
jgi:hypothetical protein